MAERYSSMTQGQFSYLQIPATNIDASGHFYEVVFGWKRDGEASFTSPGLSGQWIEGRTPAGESGFVPWVYVEDIDEALALVKTGGGAALEEPYADGPDRWLATVRDPAGNTVGIWQASPRKRS